MPCLLCLWGHPPFLDLLPEEGTVFRISSGGQLLQPILSSPGPRQTLRIGPISFYWFPDPFLKNTLEISRDHDFLNVGQRIVGAVPGIELSLSELGRYFWRVGGRPSGTSEVWSFYVARSVGNESETEIPQGFVLYRPFPSPSTGIVNIPFESYGKTSLSLFVYDVLGREVLRETGKRVSSGADSIRLDLSNRAVGVYFVVVQTEHHRTSLSVVIQR